MVSETFSISSFTCISGLSDSFLRFSIDVGFFTSVFTSGALAVFSTFGFSAEALFTSAVLFVLFKPTIGFFASVVLFSGCGVLSTFFRL